MSARHLLALLIAVAPLAARAEDNVAAGQALAFDRSKGNCLACHAMAGGDVPSNVGPELSGIKERFPDRNDLVAILDNEQARNPLTIMPLFGRNLILDHDEIEKIVDYLYTL